MSRQIPEQLVIVCNNVPTAGLTGEYPWCVVDEKQSQGLRVIGFKTFDNELDGCVFLASSQHKPEWLL
jgi:hypothetical protein